MVSLWVLGAITNPIRPKARSIWDEVCVYISLWVPGAFVDWVPGALAEGVNVLRESTVNLYMPDGLSHSA